MRSKAFQQIYTFLLQIGISNSGARKTSQGRVLCKLSDGPIGGMAGCLISWLTGSLLWEQGCVYYRALNG